MWLGEEVIRQLYVMIAAILPRLFTLSATYCALHRTAFFPGTGSIPRHNNPSFELIAVRLNSSFDQNELSQ